MDSPARYTADIYPRSEKQMPPLSSTHRKQCRPSTSSAFSSARYSSPLLAAGRRKRKRAAAWVSTDEETSTSEEEREDQPWQPAAIDGLGRRWSTVDYVTSSGQGRSMSVGRPVAQSYVSPSAIHGLGISATSP